MSLASWPWRASLSIRDFEHTTVKLHRSRRAVVRALRTPKRDRHTCAAQKALCVLPRESGQAPVAGRQACSTCSVSSDRRCVPVSADRSSRCWRSVVLRPPRSCSPAAARGSDSRPCAPPPRRECLWRAAEPRSLFSDEEKRARRRQGRTFFPSLLVEPLRKRHRGARQDAHPGQRTVRVRRRDERELLRAQHTDLDLQLPREFAPRATRQPSPADLV